MTTQWHGGKGSRMRSAQVSAEVVANNWDNIFNKKGYDYESDPRTISNNERCEVSRGEKGLPRRANRFRDWLLETARILKETTELN